MRGDAPCVAPDIPPRDSTPGDSSAISSPNRPSAAVHATVNASSSRPALIKPLVASEALPAASCKCTSLSTSASSSFSMFLMRSPAKRLQYSRDTAGATASAASHSPISFMSSQYDLKSPSSSLSVAAFRSATSFLSPPLVFANRASSSACALAPTKPSTSHLCGTEIPVAPKPRVSFTPVDSIVARCHSSSAAGSPESAANAAPKRSPSELDAAIFWLSSRPAARPTSRLRSLPSPRSSPTSADEDASFPSTARIFAAGQHSSVLQKRIVESREHVTAMNGRAGCVAMA